MSSIERKWKTVEDRLKGWATPLIAGLTRADLREAWMAAQALQRRPASRTTPSLSPESAFEAALQRLQAARSGGGPAVQAWERLLREGYRLDREESLAGFTADLDGAAWDELAALACFAHRERGLEPREAVIQALRLGYDRALHPDPAVRDESDRTLRSVVAQVGASPAMRQAVAGFAAVHMRPLEGLAGA
jgi:hypothetical protein